jgi:starch-binding outer membrane protein, SusD/RagB family
VEGVPDTRVAAINTNTNGHDNATPVWVVAKHGASRSPTTGPAAAHRDVAGGPPDHRRGGGRPGGGEPGEPPAGAPRPAAYTGGTTPAEIQALIIQERARELYLEGHHLGDLRRFDIPNTPAAGEPYRQGGSYGSVRCFPLPAVEKTNNPNF